MLALVAAPLVALGACGPQPQPAIPALWEVTGPDGARGWLFGTIHSLDRPAQWRSPRLAAALDAADVLVVEVADLDDRAAMAKAFAELAHSPGLPPLSRRIAPQLHDELAKTLEKSKLGEDYFATLETWAAAITLAKSGAGSLDPAYGIDRALLAQAQDRQVVELEGAAAQLAIFDRLPATEQRHLLEAVLRDAGALDTESGSLAKAWLAGDMERIGQETRRGLLADPELRAALYEERNRRWADRIARMANAGRKPFVAVGAAHMAGDESLPVLLAAKGFTVRRIQ